MTQQTSAEYTHVAGYRTPARVLHWLVALIVLATIPAGQIMIMDGVPRPTANLLFIFHKNVGVIILLLVLLRLIYRAFNPPPPLPDSVPTWQRRASAVSHGALYVLLLVMAVSGYTRVEAGNFPIEGLDALGIQPLVPVSKPLAETAKTIHANAHFLLIAFVLLHIAAALYHAIALRDGVFSRMWPPRAR